VNIYHSRILCGQLTRLSVNKHASPVNDHPAIQTKLTSFVLLFQKNSAFKCYCIFVDCWLHAIKT